MGVEPIRCCHHGILSPARLPIPSRRHNSIILSQLCAIYNKKLEKKIQVFTAPCFTAAVSLRITTCTKKHIVKDKLDIVP